MQCLEGPDPREHSRRSKCSSENGALLPHTFRLALPEQAPGEQVSEQGKGHGEGDWDQERQPGEDPEVES